MCVCDCLCVFVGRMIGWVVGLAFVCVVVVVIFLNVWCGVCLCCCAWVGLYCVVLSCVALPFSVLVVCSVGLLLMLFYFVSRAVLRCVVC